MRRGEGSPGRRHRRDRRGGIPCKECGRRFHNLGGHLVVHEMTPGDYEERHGKGYRVSLTVRRKISFERDRFTGRRMIIPTSERRVLAAVRRSLREDPFASTARKRAVRGAVKFFGSWRAAVERLGLAGQVSRAWTASRTLAALRSYVASGGAPKTSALVRADHGLAYAARRHFGSVHRAFRAAGIAPVARTSWWTRARVIEGVRARHARGRSMVGAVAFREESRLVSAARWRFGSWRRAVEAAGLARSLSLPMTDRALHRALQRYARGRAPVSKDPRAHERLKSAARRRYGGVRAALAALGLRPPRPAQAQARARPGFAPDGRPRCPICGRAVADLPSHAQLIHGLDRDSYEARHGRYPYRRWTRDLLVGALRAYAQAGGRAMTSMLHHVRPELFRAALGYFRSIPAAFQAAGVTLPPPLFVWTKTLLVRELRRRQRAGERLVSTAMPSLLHAAVRHYGSWHAALRIARVPPPGRRARTGRAGGPAGE